MPIQTTFSGASIVTESAFAWLLVLMNRINFFSTVLFKESKCLLCPR